jgi:hypothetical protein
MSSWFNPKTEKRTSPIQGHGLFARLPIPAGEVVAVKGGAIMDFAAFAPIRDQVSPAEIQIEDHLYIAPRSREEIIRDVPAGGELTIDYAMIDGDPSERMDCSCGASECRKVITGDDWRLPDLQRRYAGYFSRYIADRFNGYRA